MSLPVPLPDWLSRWFGADALTPGLRYALDGALAPRPAPAPVIGTALGDRLELGVGAVDGGAGIDTLVVRLDHDLAAGRAFNPGRVAGGGFDLDDRWGTYRRVTGIERFEITGRTTGDLVDNDITGGADIDRITGGPGDDLLDGGVGNDTLIGGAGDDVYTLDSLFDRVTELSGEGYDTVFASQPITLPANVEALYLVGNVVSGTGNALDNLIVGDAGVNLLRGQGGDDRLFGGGGNDRLEGGAGDDQLDGGAGVNSAIYRLDTDWTRGAAFDGSAIGPWGGTLVIDGGPGNRDTLSAVHKLEVNGFTALPNRIVGSSGADIIRGGALADILDGGPGADVLIGGGGDDRYTVDNAADSVLERPGEGVDTVYASLTYTLTPDVETLVLTGSAFAATGNEGANTLVGNDRGNRLRGMGGDDRLEGLVGADLLQGGSGDDVILGGADDDTLDGGPGADRLEGGTGADIFVLRRGEAAGDVIADFQSGADKLQLVGWGAGTSVARGGGADAWTITDGADGATATLTILGGAVAPSDLLFG